MQAVDLGLTVTNMTKPKNQLFCRLDGLTPLARKEQRAKALSNLGLLSTEAVPTFEETTQKAVTFSGAPIAILGLVVEEELWFKSATGLATIGLTAELAARRKIALDETFSTYVIDSQQPLVIENTFVDLVFANSVLTQYYGIKAYLGVPLISPSGICIGTLSVMDWTERKFDDRDIDHLTLLARWCLGEFERNRLHQNRSRSQQADSLVLPSSDLSVSFTHTAKAIESQHKPKENSIDTITDPIKLELLSQLTQELKTPLTSVIGMTSVLHREVYGPLTDKQKEYLEIIYNSGQNLIALVDEIVSLGVLNDRHLALDLAATDLEMLCQQVVNSLRDVAKQHQQELQLSIEPGNRIWSLDKDKVRQALYYLIVSVLEMSEPGGQVKIHVSRRDRALNIAVEAFHPWLGADFGEVKSCSQALAEALDLNRSGNSDDRGMRSSAFGTPTFAKRMAGGSSLPSGASSVPGMADINSRTGNISDSDYPKDTHYEEQYAKALDLSTMQSESFIARRPLGGESQVLTASSLMTVINNQKDSNSKSVSKIPRDLLGLLFCCHLIELHEGRVVVRGSRSNYRYLLQFPNARVETASTPDV